jgi:hypothetical protein
MLSSRKCFVTFLFTLLVTLPACAKGENEARTAERLGDLSAPPQAGPLRVDTPADQQAPARACVEVEEYVGESLFYLGSSLAGLRPPRCWLSVATDPRDHWGAGVFYLIESARPKGQSLLSIIEDGGIYIIMIFNLRGASPQPGDIDYAPTFPPWAARVTVRGRDGVIERLSERTTLISWDETVGGMGTVRIRILAGMDPDKLYDLAQNLSRSPS